MRVLLRHMRALPVAVGLAALLALAGCSGNGALAPGFEGLSGPPQLISEAEERKLGAREHPRIVAAFGGAYQDPQVQAGLEQIVNRLGRSSDRPDITYTITILNSPSVNAFALPGGYLYVTRGLLALANDADELAAVLAHEMGHVSARHAAKRQSEAIRAVFVGRLEKVLRDPSALGQALRDNESTMASFSRAQELEADRIGLEMSTRAGFDPYGAVSFLEAMMRESEHRASILGRDKDRRQPDLDSSHPATPERINRVSGLSEDLGFKPGQRDRERDQYLSVIDGMLYGDDPREGFVRGQQFLHPGHRFAFSVPEGYSLQNAQDAVFAVSGDDTALRFDGIELSESQPLTDYVSSIWGQGTEAGTVKEISVNGMPGALAEAYHEGWHYRMAAVRFSRGKVYRFLFAARRITPQDEADFRAIVDSLRALSGEQAAALKPLRIRIATVRNGDTLATLARRMEHVDHPLARLRVINGLASGEAPDPGTKVKLILE